MRVTVALLLVAAVTSGIGWSLHQTDSGLMGTNGVRPLAFVENLESDSTICQPLGVRRRLAEKLRMTVGTYGKGPQLLRFSVRGDRRTVLDSGYGEGVSDFALPAPSSTTAEILCITNKGSAPVALAGETAAGGIGNEKQRPYSLSFGIVGAPRTWDSRLGELRSRLSRGQVDLGGSAPTLAILAALACLTYSIVALTRTL